MLFAGGGWYAAGLRRAVRSTPAPLEPDQRNPAVDRFGRRTMPGIVTSRWELRREGDITPDAHPRDFLNVAFVPACHCPG